MRLEIEKILRKNQNGFRGNRSNISEIFTIRRWDLCKKYWFNTIVSRYHPSHLIRYTIRKIEQILQAYELLKETVSAIMMLHKNTKAMVRSSEDGDINIGIVAGVLLGDIFASYLLICLDYVLRISIDLIKENGFTLEKAKSRRYLAETITNADYYVSYKNTCSIWISPV